MTKSEEEFLKEHSYEAQDAFLNDLFTVTLHGPLPGETQKKLFAASAGMHSRCYRARKHIEERIASLEKIREGSKDAALEDMWSHVILELNAVLRFLS